MTTTAADQFTTVATAGTGETWSGTSNLTDGNSGEAIATAGIASPSLKTLRLSIPGYMSGLDDGSEFDSLKVTVYSKTGGGSTTLSCGLAGGSNSYSLNVSTSYAQRTMDGDASYWGISGTPAEIFADLKDGSLYFWIDGSILSTIYVKDIYATLTYTLPDTKRASLMTVAL